MPKAKAFSARKSRAQPYSTNPETARIREIEQSRVGLSAEIARINTKYRTRLSRAILNIVNAVAYKCIVLEPIRAKCMLQNSASRAERTISLARSWLVRWLIRFASEPTDWLARLANYKCCARLGSARSAGSALCQP